MTLHITIDREVIEKYLHKLVQVLFEGSADYPLESWWPIFNTKWYHHPNKSSVICYKSYFVSMFGAIKMYKSKYE
jgi:hypothetical protein